jgi:hypothetical protein
MTVLRLCFRYNQGFEESVNRTGLMLRRKQRKEGVKGKKGKLVRKKVRR